MGRAKGKAKRRARDQHRARKTHQRKQKRKGRSHSKESTPMSRSRDIAFIEDRVKALQAEQQATNTKYQEYAARVAESIRDALVNAGVYDEVQALELERAEVQKEAQDKINGLQEQIQEFMKTRNFLLKREEDDPTATASSEEPEDPEPEPESGEEPEPEAEESSEEEPEAAESSEEEPSVDPVVTEASAARPSRPSF